MTVYELNNLTLNPLVVYTMCGDKEISIFTQHGPDGNIPELLEDFGIRKIWCEDGLIAVLI